MKSETNYLMGSILMFCAYIFIFVYNILIDSLSIKLIFLGVIIFMFGIHIAQDYVLFKTMVKKIRGIE